MLFSSTFEKIKYRKCIFLLRKRGNLLSRKTGTSSSFQKEELFYSCEFVAQITYSLSITLLSEFIH